MGLTLLGKLQESKSPHLLNRHKPQAWRQDSQLTQFTLQKSSSSASSSATPDEEGAMVSQAKLSTSTVNTFTAIRGETRREKAG